MQQLTVKFYLSVQQCNLNLKKVILASDAILASDLSENLADKNSVIQKRKAKKK